MVNSFVQCILITKSNEMKLKKLVHHAPELYRLSYILIKGKHVSPTQRFTAIPSGV